MINVFLTVILLFLLTPVDFSFAQSHDHWARKIYSGHLHLSNAKPHAFWSRFFGKKSPAQQEDYGRQCSIEFKSPIPFTHQLVVELPQELTYFVSFNNGGFKRFTINIYDNDQEEYSIDPNEEGRQIAINGEHHIFDAYLVYLILSQDINHIEIVGSSGDKGTYVLDKLEIRNNNYN